MKCYLDMGHQTCQSDGKFSKDIFADYLCFVHGKKKHYRNEAVTCRIYEDSMYKAITFKRGTFHVAMNSNVHI